MKEPHPSIEAVHLESVVETPPRTRLPCVETGTSSTGVQRQRRFQSGRSGSGRVWIILMLCGFGIYLTSIAAFSSPTGILLGLGCILSGATVYLCHGPGSIADQNLHIQNADMIPSSGKEKAAQRPTLSEPMVCITGGDVPVIDEGVAAAAASHSEEERAPSPVALPT